MSKQIKAAFGKLARQRSSKASKRWQKGLIAAKARKHTETSIKMIPVANHHVQSKKKT